MSRKAPKLADESLVDRTSEIKRRIAERAYYLAESWGFESGHELDDWLEAETCESPEPSIGFPELGFKS